MSNHRKFSFLRGFSKGTGILLICSTLFVNGEASAATYNVIDLATLSQGTSTVVRGPNGTGTAVGGGRTVSNDGVTNTRQGLILDSNALQQISGLPRSDYTNVFGINDVRVVVGASNTATAVRGFKTTPAGATQELPPLAGDTGSTAFAINNSGQAAGFSSGPAGERAVIWTQSGGAIALPGASGLTVMRALGINDRNDVVGVVNDGNGRRAVLWAGAGTPQQLDLLPGHATNEAAGINATGDVVGYSADASGTRRATLWPKRGGVIDLGALPGGDFSQAFGINEAGQVVGSSTGASGNRAFLWTSSAGLQDLNDLIAPSPFVLTKAVGINNVGTIVAIGRDLDPTHADGHEDHESPIRVFLLIRAGN